jgi:hypothetical protein
MRRLIATALPGCGATLGSLILPGAAHAASNMPQMDFSNPLNLAQVVWLVIIRSISSLPNGHCPG